MADSYVPAIATGTAAPTVAPTNGVIDRTTVVYGAAGVLLGANNVGAVPTLVLGVLAKVLDGPLRSFIPFLPATRREAEVNAAADLAALMVGWWGIRQVPPPPPPTPPASPPR